MSHLPLQTTVTAYFDVPTTPVFILSDPVKGKLDDTTYVLAGDIATDITADVTNVKIKRGRSRWLNEITSGTFSVAFDNKDGDYNPIGAGAYTNNIVPGKRIQIDAGGLPIFDGLVDDWDVTYQLNKNSIAVAVGSDVLTRLGRQKIDSFTTTSELSGARVNAILDQPEVDFPAGQRNIDTGLTTLQADTIPADVDVVTYLQLVSRTESGRLFAAADGVLTFQQRNTAPSTANVPKLADDGTGIPYVGLDIAVGSELLYNRAEVTREGGTTQVEDNTASQTTYGIRTVVQNGLLFNSDIDAESYAEYLVNKYATPEARFSAIDINLVTLTTQQAATVCALELGDVVQIVFTAPGNDPIDQYAIVEGIAHDINLNTHRVQLALSSLQEGAFILDDQVFGVLDSDAVLSY